MKGVALAPREYSSGAVTDPVFVQDCPPAVTVKDHSACPALVRLKGKMGWLERTSPSIVHS